jgi:preprotein translocase subunit SecE
MSVPYKFGQMFIAIALFVAVMGVVLFLADRVRSRRGEIVQT